MLVIVGWKLDSLGWESAPSTARRSCSPYSGETVARSSAVSVGLNAQYASNVPTVLVPLRNSEKSPVNSSRAETPTPVRSSSIVRSPLPKLSIAKFVLMRFHSVSMSSVAPTGTFSSKLKPMRASLLVAEMNRPLCRSAALSNSGEVIVSYVCVSLFQRLRLLTSCVTSVAGCGTERRLNPSSRPMTSSTISTVSVSAVSNSRTSTVTPSCGSRSSVSALISAVATPSSVTPVATGCPPIVNVSLSPVDSSPSLRTPLAVTVVVGRSLTLPMMSASIETDETAPAASTSVVGPVVTETESLTPSKVWSRRSSSPVATSAVSLILTVISARPLNPSKLTGSPIGISPTSAILAVRSRSSTPILKLLLSFSSSVNVSTEATSAVIVNAPPLSVVGGCPWTISVTVRLLSSVNVSLPALTSRVTGSNPCPLTVTFGVDSVEARLNSPAASVLTSDPDSVSRVAPVIGSLSASVTVPVISVVFWTASAAALTLIMPVPYRMSRSPIDGNFSDALSGFSAVSVSAALISCGPRSRSVTDSKSATAPATCGCAIEVPCVHEYPSEVALTPGAPALFPSGPELRTNSPGAATSG